MIVLQCIQDGLSVLGEDGKAVVLWLWETKRGLSAQKIPSHVGEFSKLLQDTFGAGARILENHITLEIARTFNLPSDMVSDLIGSVETAREKFNEERS